MFIIDWLPAIGVAIFAGMVVALEIGFRIGVRRGAKLPADGDDGTGAIEAAVFGLLGLILAFSFSGAMTRLETRRAMIVQEANAIGTAWLRVDLLPEPDQPAIRDLFREYTDSRIAVFANSKTMDDVLREIDRGTALQNQIWSKAVASLKSEGAVPPAVVQIFPALNEMIDITTTRKVAMFTHLPELILWLQVGIAIISALLAGYTMSKRRKGVRSWFIMGMYALVVSLTMYVVLDLEFPRVGLITLESTDQVLLEVRASMR
jgi:hypothetical protein